MTDTEQPGDAATNGSATSDVAAQNDTAPSTEDTKKGMWLLDGSGQWTNCDSSNAHIQRVLVDALNSTNLITLLGSGASMATHTDQSEKKAPSMPDLWKSSKENVGPRLFDKVVSKMFFKPDNENIESLLSLCKMYIEVVNARKKEDSDDLEQNLGEFVKKSEEAILDCVDFISDETNLDHHIRFLRRLTRRNSEKPRLKVFTTNYDTCIEDAALMLNIVSIDGFSHSVEQRYNRDYFDYDIVRRSLGGTSANYIDGVMHLYKMHGSMDWRRRVSDGAVIRSTSHDSKYKPVLIYPRSTKYQEAFIPPFLDMFAAWQEALRQPDTTLIVCGFGFSDDHVSAPIWSALESNLSIRLILCDPMLASPIPMPDIADPSITKTKMITQGSLNTYQKRIISLVKNGDTRITVLNGKFEDLASKIPDISGETERDKVKKRIEDAAGEDNGF